VGCITSFIKQGAHSVVELITVEAREHCGILSSFIFVASNGQRANSREYPQWPSVASAFA